MYVHASFGNFQEKNIQLIKTLLPVEFVLTAKSKCLVSNRSSSTYVDPSHSIGALL